MKRWVLIASLLGLAGSGVADVILSDPFDNGVLGTYTTGVNGGFGIIGSGNGDVSEANGVASITSSSNQNDVKGMLSSGTVSLSSVAGATELRTTWIVDSSDLKANSSSLTFTWQTSDSLSDPEIGVMLDLINSTAFLYVGSTNEILGSIDLDVDFGDPGHAFSLVATFSSGAFLVQGTGTLRDSSDQNVSFGGDWGAHPRSLENYHVGAVVNANGTAGLVVDVDSVAVEAIPEPAVAGLIGLFGGGMIFYRRIFGRNKAGSGA